MSSRTCRPVFLALILTLAVGCIPALAEPMLDVRRDAAELWNEAHRALYLGQLQVAEEHFVELADAHPDTDHGREALFFAGLLRLDPDHPEWSAEVAAARLVRYLGDNEVMDEGDVEADDAPRHRAPEARTALALARQFQLPADQRIQPLRPVVRTVPAETPPVPADATPAQLRAEIERLVGQVAERDETIRRQREELERIRRTLIPDDD